LGRALADVPFVGVEDGASQRVQLLAFVELATDPGAELFVGEPGENEVGLGQPPVLLQGLGERVASRAGLQAAEQQRGKRPPVPQRHGEPQQLVPPRAWPVRAWLTERALEHERPSLLFAEACGELRRRRIERPAVATLMRLRASRC
jgi:Domain of unknown function (DUF4158)